MILSETTSRLERGLRGELSTLAVLDPPPIALRAGMETPLPGCC